MPYQDREKKEDLTMGAMHRRRCSGSRHLHGAPLVPRMENKGAEHILMVEGKPFLVEKEREKGEEGAGHGEVGVGHGRKEREGWFLFLVY